MGIFECLKKKRKIHTKNSKNEEGGRQTIKIQLHTNGTTNKICNATDEMDRYFLSSDTPNIQDKIKKRSSEYSKKFLESRVNSKMIQAGTVGSTLGSSAATLLMETVADNNNMVDDDIFKNYDFPFTNLVFEGGGNKGMAYVGALQVLEEVGIAQKVKRVCGASVGAITASLVAVGYTSEDLKEFMETDLRKVLVDHRCGYCSLLPNLLKGFGWNPGNKLLKWFGEQLKDRTGDADITFRQVLQRYGRELCIVVTNLSQMSTEYFHPKTTPTTPIRTAVRMSTALPGVFQSYRHVTDDGTMDVYVDGGLLCNYPIHAFDGWWLSMHPKDSFFKRLQPLDNYAHLFSKQQRFGTWNPETLGIMLYSNSETELMKTKLAERVGNEAPPPPQSKLYRKRRKLRIQESQATKEHEAVVKAVGRFMKQLHKMHFDMDGVVSAKELKTVFESAKEFSLEDRILLFGNADIKEAFKELDRDDDGEITFQELMSFIERKGVNIQTRFLGYKRRDIRSLGDFISTLQTALAINVKRNYVEDRDIERTIGIDTGYIEANDFHLEADDKRFLVESGARATRAFLRHYCQKNPLYRRRQSALLSKGFFNSSRSRRTEESPNTLKPAVVNGRLATYDSKNSLADKSTSDLSSVDSRNSSRRSSDISEISLVNMPFWSK